jgi:hypothetical protein
MEEWITMKDAAKKLKVSYYKLSQLAMTGEIETKDSLRDKRVKLVNTEQIKQKLGIV